jgi:hypothetical protein
MKKKYYRLLIGIALFPLAGCHLIDMDDILHHPDKIPQLCDIKKITFTSPFEGDPLIKDVFYYNKWGNPDSIVSNLSTSGHPGLRLFRYDKQRRLTEYLVGFGYSGAYFIWQKFTYDTRNRIIADSTYGFGDMVNGRPFPPVNTQYHMRNLYTYDAYDRIVHVDHYFGSSGPYAFDYVYNSQGNLDNGYSSYDNKVNIHRTNKIWMFLDRNYSINNPVIGASIPVPGDYNKYGLPLKLTDATLFLGNNLLNSSITYSCK